MEKEYNVKKRMHSNGVIQYRIYQKACTFGGYKKPPDASYKVIENPFVEIRKQKIRKYLDSDGWTIPVGGEKQNLDRSVRRTKDKVYDYANAVVWEWFCTFTFDATKVDRMDYASVSKKMTKWLNNMRQRYCPSMKYLLVPEKHKDGSYHLHGLFADADGLCFKEAINKQEYLQNGRHNRYYGKPLVRKGQQVYDIGRFNLGLTDATRVLDTRKVANYVLKYITKEMVVDTENRKRYWVTQNLPKVHEEVAFVSFSDYDKFVSEFFVNIAEGNAQAYCRTFEVAHGDFATKVTYITI